MTKASTGLAATLVFLCASASASAQGLPESKDDFLGLYLAESQRLMFISAEICSVKAEKAAARDAIEQERAGASIGGYVDKEVMYEAGQEIAAADAKIKDMTARLRMGLKKSPMACTETMDFVAQQMSCSHGTDGCDEHILTAGRLALEWLAGDLDLETLAFKARSVADPEWLAEAEQLDRKITVWLASKSRKSK